ncbi:M20 family metallopeptidase [Fodinisporobacter ferrooxydans]|uniref:M20 family metallopeptidase n=1 Tax=Fodinisporobacter ferrooxydans TaxID=2901836 RepID=A0ABY4CRP3_9BACL|nr:M20 family metallopeptidase [Alicyclobacillaceae bacterium MYW30-H2]
MTQSERWSGYFEEQRVTILSELQRYVEFESPSHEKEAVDRLGSYIARQFSALGCEVAAIPQTGYGNQLRMEYGSGDRQLMILGHFDTVKEIGTLVKEPWKIENGKAFGPGIFDMKAGIVFSYFALKAIVENGLSLNKKLVFFWNTDEEVGSPSSRRWIEEEARKSDYVLVVEPTGPNGAAKTSRKGGGDFIIRAYGKAAHAGNDHAKGINALEELAHHILEIQSWTDYAEGTTLSVGTAHGGTATNVVPEFAEACVDVRISKKSEAERITAQMQNLQPVLQGAALEIDGEISILPLERTPDSERLFAHAKQQAALEELQLTEANAGGTSDGNFAAAVGTPTLDGLGPVGDGAHASHEHIVIGAIPQRIALLLRLFTTL